jgi:prepilin-type N-terminal cleavage/methylation domain-containing protein
MNSRGIRNRKQAGFTLVELGIVLALIGIGLFFAISKINETNDQSRAQSVSNDLTFTITNVKRLFATQANFPAQGDAAYGNGVLRQNSVFPAAWNDPANPANVIAPFSGNPTVDRRTPAFQTAGNFAAITIPSVPTRVCSELGRLMATGIAELEVNGVVVKPLNTPLNVATLGTNCSAAAEVPMIFTFARN